MSSKREKPSPRIVFRYGKQDQQIKNYVENRHLIKQITKKTYTANFSVFLVCFSCICVAKTQLKHAINMI